MKKWILKLSKLFLGYFVVAIGIVMTINADLGLAPWDAFHQGLSRVTGITIGQASITVGGVIIALDFVLGERIGWGSIFNMIFIGMFMDVLMLNNLIPTFDGYIPRFIMMLLGLFIQCFGTYLYISAELGSGPRDGLMVALVKKTKKPVRLIKSLQETVIVFVGYLLGGRVGIGTFVMALLSGYFLQSIFKTFKLDVNELHHRFIDDDIKYIKDKLKGAELHINK